MTTSDKAWIWAGYNYTDDGCTLEKLAIRFKNCETAQAFYKMVRDVLGKLQVIEASKGHDKQEFIPSTVENIEIGNLQGNDRGEVYEYDEEDDEDEENDDDDDDGR